MSLYASLSCTLNESFSRNPSLCAMTNSLGRLGRSLGVLKLERCRSLLSMSFYNRLERRSITSALDELVLSQRYITHAASNSTLPTFSFPQSVCSSNCHHTVVSLSSCQTRISITCEHPQLLFSTSPTRTTTTPPNIHQPHQSLNISQTDTQSTNQSLTFGTSSWQRKNQESRSEVITNKKPRHQTCQPAHHRHHQHQQQHQNPNHQHQEHQNQQLPGLAPQKHTSPSTPATWPPKSCNPTNNWPGTLWRGMK
jgi:hypothetical protein